MVLYCNQRIVAVDFSVLESKQYTFFIDDELCEVQLKREGEYFRYYFNLNREVDTDRNREIRKTDRKNWRWTAVIATLIVVLGVLFALWMSNSSKGKHADWLAENMHAANNVKAMVTQPRAPGEPLYLAYMYGGKAYKHQVESADFEFPLPLEIGDELLLKCAWEDYSVCSLLLKEALDTTQLALFMERTAFAHQEFNPDKDAATVQCEVEAAYEFQALEGLANLMYQQRAPEKAVSGNRERYLAMLRDEGFLNALESCLETAKIDTFAPK